nr:la-related protein 6B isoform X4 [Arachis hypogaea]
MAQESLTEAPDMCPSSSHADPSLSRNLSSSRLNAQAPEFVPTRPTTRLVVPPPPPPPPPSGMVHVYPPPPTSPFHVQIQGHVPAVQNHHHHHLAHQHHHHVQAHYRSHHHPHQYHVGTDSGVPQVQQSHGESDHTPSSKSKLSEEASQKILNQSRIVVAENLPEDHCHQNLMKVFSAVGSVKTIRTCPPQTSNSGASSASRLGKVDGVHLANKLHAFVEYESVELAERAVAELNDERNWRSGLRVRQMVRCMPKPSQGRGKKGFDTEANCEEDYTSLPEQQANEKPVEDAPVADTHTHGHVEEHAYEKESGQRKGRSRGRGKGRGRVHSRVNNQLGTQTSNSNNSILTEQVVAKQPPGPRMPDGTRGFSMGRGKPIAVNIP